MADIDRDNGILYYSTFDGATVELLAQWYVGSAGDDFHCPVICSDGKGTVIIEFMLHSWTNTGSYSDAQQHNCENMMLIGKKVASELHSVSFEDVPVSPVETFISENFDVYPTDTELTYNENQKCVGGATAGEYTAALVFKDLSLYNPLGTYTDAYFYIGNKTAGLYNSDNPSRFGDMNMFASSSNVAVLEIGGKMYSYRHVENALPALQLRTKLLERPFTPPTDTQCQISGVIESTSELGLTKQIPMFLKTTSDCIVLKDHKRVKFE